MAQITLFDEHVSDYEKWYETYNEIYQSEILAVREQLQKLPENIRGVEVGLGTGRFASQLGIKEGVEPSRKMASRAINRGIEVIEGFAAQLPYGDLQFDFVLFVTICHIDHFKEALKEANRVLKHKGTVIIGFLDKDQPIAEHYIEKRHRSTFFAKAEFYTVKRIQAMLKEAGFKDFEFNQTLWGNLDEIKRIQLPKAGYGEASFVVVKATKK